MKHPIRVSRGHMGDLEAAALNCGNKKLQERFEEMKKDPGFEIVDNPKPDEFLQDLSIMFMYANSPPTIPDLNIPKLTTVQDVIDKAMVFDPALENADPAIVTSKVIPFAELNDIDLEDMYQYQYPKNVKWLIEIRKDFIEKHHPEELTKGE